VRAVTSTRRCTAAERWVAQRALRQRQWSGRGGGNCCAGGGVGGAAVVPAEREGNGDSERLLGGGDGAGGRAVDTSASGGAGAVAAATEGGVWSPKAKMVVKPSRQPCRRPEVEGRRRRRRRRGSDRGTCSRVPARARRPVGGQGVVTARMANRPCSQHNRRGGAQR